jgi:hypothetical protein
MAEKLQLHVLFTMNCEPPAERGDQDAPRTWDQGGRSIDSYCTRVLRAGYTPTLFVAPACAEEQDPLFEDLLKRGAEVGLYLHPPQIGDGRFRKSLGQYSPGDQRQLIEYATAKFVDRIGQRPLSFRGGHFSASDQTAKVLFDLGYRQGSLSEPGRRLGLREAIWTDAPHDPYHVDPEQRGRPGSLPFLEIPVTTDTSGEIARGVPWSLLLGMGNYEILIRPTVEYALARMEREQVEFRTLCIYTNNRHDFYTESAQPADSLEQLLDLLETLSETYEIVPVTMAAAHDRYRAIRRMSSDG